MDEQKAFSHSFILKERKNLIITGVRDVESFDEGSLIVYTDMGEILIKGEKIKVDNFSSETGELSANGVFQSAYYSERQEQKNSFISRLFK